MQARTLGGEDLLEEGTATHSILAWRIPWTEEPGGLRFIRLQRAGHNQSNLACMHVSRQTSAISRRDQEPSRLYRIVQL